jgi:hypothetical protein
MPAAAAPTAVDVVVDAPLAPPAPAPDYELVATMGRQLSGPVASMQSIVQALLDTGKISRRKVQMLLGDLAAVRQLSMQSQQLLRLAQSPLRQSHERVRLDQLLLQALDEHVEAFKLHAVELVQRIRPVEVILDPGMVTSLVNAALDCAAVPGSRLLVTLELGNWPEHGVLTLKTLQSVTGGQAPVSPPGLTDSLVWSLLNETARASAVLLGHAEAPGQSTLTIEFPRTVRQLEGLTMSDMEAEEDSMSHADSKMVSGQHILLISSDPALRMEVTRVCLRMGLVIDTSLTSALAVRHCEIEKPQLIIVDERIADTTFDELREDFQRLDPGFPMIGIADDSNTLSMSSWMEDSMARIGRSDLPAQLPRILAVELTKAL